MQIVCVEVACVEDCPLGAAVEANMIVPGRNVNVPCPLLQQLDELPEFWQHHRPFSHGSRTYISFERSIPFGLSLVYLI